MIYISSDHGGFELKKHLIDFLEKENINVIDMGPEELNEDDDYPDYVIPTMEKIQQDKNSVGIVICRNGAGVSILANKFKGIRAALSWNPEHAKTTKLDDNTNVLALPADYIDKDTAIKTLATWLATEFSWEQRHARRLTKVEEFENK